MRLFSMVLAISVLTTGPEAASAQTEVTSVVHQWADGFNRADAQVIAASCADQASLVDDFPPHEWNGVGACARWLIDFRAFATQAEITDAIIAVGEPGHVDITADVAYVVAPTTLTYRVKGKAAKLDGIITVILRKTAASWRISALTWADV